MKTLWLSPERALATKMDRGVPRSSKPKVVTASPQVPPSDSRLPMPGTVITRNYKGEILQVKVLSEGFEYLGERFPSLSAVAKSITGSHCNGFHFFKLKGNT